MLVSMEFNLLAKWNYWWKHGGLGRSVKQGCSIRVTLALLQIPLKSKSKTS